MTLRHSTLSPVRPHAAANRCWATARGGWGDDLTARKSKRRAGPCQREGVGVERAHLDCAVEVNSTVRVGAFDNNPCSPNTPSLAIVFVLAAVANEHE